MKKFLSLILIFIMLIFVFSCGDTADLNKNEDSPADKDADHAASNDEEDTVQSPQPSPDENKTYTLVFHINGEQIVYENLKQGAPITIPAPKSSQLRYSWDKNIPAYMPANDCTFTAVTLEGNITSNVTWSYDFTSVLTVSGKGAVPNYSENNQPWSDYKNDIHTLTLNEGITSIGKYTFFGLTNIRSVVIPNSVQKIGSYAFAGCDCISSIVIGSGVTNMGTAVFVSTQMLSQVEFKGEKVWYVKDGDFGNTLTMTSDTYSNAQKLYEYRSAQWSISEGAFPNI